MKIALTVIVSVLFILFFAVRAIIKRGEEDYYREVFNELKRRGFLKITTEDSGKDE